MNPFARGSSPGPLVGCALILLLAPVPPGMAAAPAREPVEAPVVVWYREITVLRTPFELYSPQDRAQRAVRNILAIPQGRAEYRVEAMDAEVGAHSGAWITVNGQPVLGLLHKDANVQAGEAFEHAKASTVANLQEWLKAREEQRRWPLLIRGLASALIATLLFAGAAELVVLGWRRLARARRTARPILVGGMDLRPQVTALTAGFLRVFAWGLIFVLGYVWLTFILTQFPYSLPWGKRLSGFLLGLFSQFATAIVDAMPDLFTVLVIFLLAYQVVRAVTAFFRGAESGAVRTAWLWPEAARATRYLVVVFIWIFALAIAYPHIPGSDTEAFKGLSVLVGLMVSLGSAGLVAQLVGGLVAVFARLFRTGEYVKVGEHEGVVLDIGLLSTKILTPNKEEITFPNSVLVGTTPINYSRHAEGNGSIISTSVTIGYDAPWRQVHAMLLLAAERTAGVLATPPPFVLQRGLLDPYVEYQLVATIDRPADRFAILSELNAAIQDAFNEQGVQIMSPNFVLQPRKPVVVPKENWHLPPAK